MVVDVAENGTGTDTVSAILGVDELAETVHDDGAVLTLTLLLVLLGLKSRPERHDSANHSDFTLCPTTCLCYTENLDVCRRSF